MDALSARASGVTPAVHVPAFAKKRRATNMMTRMAPEMLGDTYRAEQVAFERNFVVQAARVQSASASAAPVSAQ